MEHTSFASQIETSPEKASAYWDRHRELDNELSLLLARLPNDLRSHQYARSQGAAAVNAQIHTAIMTLHRTRICLLRAESRKASADQSIRHSQERALAGAEEIAHILRMTTDLKTTFKNPILNFSIYLACLVLIEDFLGNDRQQSRDTACFLSSILASVGEKNSVAESLYNQIRDNMMSVGISIPEPQVRRIILARSGLELIPLKEIPGPAVGYLCIEDGTALDKRGIQAGSQAPVARLIEGISAGLS
jgi:hypothetical protein